MVTQFLLTRYKVLRDQMVEFTSKSKDPVNIYELREFCGGDSLEFREALWQCIDRGLLDLTSDRKIVLGGPGGWA